MRTKARAIAVGHYTCPNPVHSKPTLAVIRRKTNGTLYGFCGEGCGLTNWNLPRGQEFFTTKGVFWPAMNAGDPPDAPRNPPAHLPEWIRLNKAWAPLQTQGTRGEPDDDTPVDPNVDPAPEAEPPAPEPAPEPKSPPKKPAKDKGFLFPWES